MFFIYQIRALQHQVSSCPDLTCPLCRSSGGVELAIFQKYAWFLMPMWPENKYGIAQCINCQQKIPNINWTDELEQRYYQRKKEIKIEQYVIDFVIKLRKTHNLTQLIRCYYRCNWRFCC